MLFVADHCGCARDIGMTKARDPQRCEHGNLYRYAKALSRSAPCSGSEGSSTGEGSQRPRRSGRKRLKRSKGFAASKAQREKVKGLACVACGISEDGRVVIDPAHLWPRGKGGCDHPDCVGPLCRSIFDGAGCHRLFDEGKLDLLPALVQKEYHREMAHPISEHGVSPTELVRRLTGGARYELVRGPGEP